MIEPLVGDASLRIVCAGPGLLVPPFLAASIDTALCLFADHGPEQTDRQAVEALDHPAITFGAAFKVWRTVTKPLIHSGSP
jgi:hypothetical protein